MDKSDAKRGLCHWRRARAGWRHIHHHFWHHLRQRATYRIVWLHQRPLFCLLAGLAIGSIIGNTIAVSPSFIVALTILLAACFWWRWPYGPLQSCSRLLLVGFLLTHLQLTWTQRALPLDHIARIRSQQPQQRLQIEGHLYRAVEAHGDRQRLYVQLHRLRDAQGWRGVSGRVRLTVKTPALAWWPGDIVQAHHVRLYPVRNFENPGRFDYRWLMHQQGIYAVGGLHRPERLQLVQRPQRWMLARTLARWRYDLIALVDAHLSSPVNAVFIAMVLGQSNRLPATIQDAFRTTGTTHLLVVSGLHVGFVATFCFMVIRALLRRLRGCLPATCLPAWRPTPVAALLCLAPVVFYCSLVGWRISTMRAALMVGSYLLALMVSRGRDMPYALGLAAAFILIADPNALLTLSFQLSFAAVAAIIMVSQRHIQRDPDHVTTPRWRWRLWLGFLTTVAAYAGTLPLLAGAFHTIPTYGSLSNVLLVPLAGLVVPAGVLALMSSVVCPALAPWVFAPLAILVAGLIAVVQYLATLPGAQLHVAAPSALMLISYYGLVGGLLMASRQRTWMPWAGLCTAVLFVGIGWQYVETRSHLLRITFLDVGTGDAILVQAPGNHTLLIDGGGTYDGRFDIGTNVVAPVLWQRYIRRFELMAITHPHPNHARGLASLFHHFPSQHLLTNGSPLASDYLRQLEATAAQRGTQIHTPQTGPRQWQWGQLQLTILSPPADPTRFPEWQPSTENDRALVLRLQYGSFRILLTGDIQGDTERWLLDQDMDLRADVLQVPHHGSKTSTSAAFVKRVQPHVGIISAGAGNPYGHPHPGVLNTLHKHHIKVFRTDRDGAVTITSDGTNYWVRPFRHVRQPR